jgi:hypothetical protein
MILTFEGSPTLEVLGVELVLHSRSGVYPFMCVHGPKPPIFLTLPYFVWKPLLKNLRITVKPPSLNCCAPKHTCRRWWVPLPRGYEPRWHVRTTVRVLRRGVIEVGPWLSPSFVVVELP